MEFRDLKKQYETLKTEIDNAIVEVCQTAHYISGAQVKELEQELAKYVGVKHCITCANGTDALSLALMAWGIGKGDAGFVPGFTFFSSGECPALTGAVPVFVDVDEYFNMSPECLEREILRVKFEGKYIPKVVIAVDLFGQPADYNRIEKLCKKYGILLLEDGAQGFGGAIDGRKACSFGDIAITSFFPAKPLGCYGDGGAIFTDNDEWGELLRSLSIHGKNGEDKYDNVRLGMNSRLDTIQAAILQIKFRAFYQYELSQVNRVADWYGERLQGSVFILPRVRTGFMSSWAQYTILLPREIDRSSLQKNLKKRGIPTMIYYMKPMHMQGAFVGTDSEKAECPRTEKICETVLSLPMHPYLTQEAVAEICNALLEETFKLK